jgi:hypothetical protein
MAPVLIPVFVVAIVVGFAAGVAIRKRRRRADVTPELHRHPERLDQMLDPTDDA